MIRLRVPGLLQYRDLAVRAVQAACKLVGDDSDTEARHRFADQVVSAFGEAFNNAAIHSYRGRAAGDVEVEIEIASDGIAIRVADYGASYEMAAIPEPDLDALPESGMGLFIIRSFMDDVEYTAGTPNVLSMRKRVRP